MNKHVLITGGSRGIGRKLVCTFSNAGWRVSFTYCRSKKEANALSETYGASAYFADFTDPEMIPSLAEAIVSKQGAVDVLINNAGVSEYGLFQDVSYDLMRTIQSVNLESPMLLTRAFLPDMIARKSGAVINVSSIWGQCGASCEVLYSTTKAALIGFTKALAKELAPSGISVNAVAPGAVDTAMLSCFSEAEKKEIAEESPLGRLVSAEEIANVCLFLAERASPALTGQVIGVNGGLYC